MLQGAPGLCSRNKKLPGVLASLLGAGATRNKKLLELLGTRRGSCY